MAEEGDQEGKTEEPTHKKVTDTLDKGNIPIAKDASVVALLVGILIYLKFISQFSVTQATQSLTTYMANVAEIQIQSVGDLAPLVDGTLQITALLVLPLCLVLLSLGLVSYLAQAKVGFHGEKISPKLSNISLSAGFKRLVSTQNLLEFAKSVFKISMLIVIAFLLGHHLVEKVVIATHLDIGEIPVIILEVLYQFTLAVLGFQTVLLAIDLIYTRYAWLQSIKMTRQEVKDEMKQSEGDPFVKGRLRAIASNRARKRMIAAVPTANVVIVNPTHYAVALRYDVERDDAPFVVAKGVDLLALRIREVAGRHNIPIVENKSLARSMYDQVEVNKSIPAQLYRAVAEILVFIGSKKHK